jgi:hypothetical protein
MVVATLVTIIILVIAAILGFWIIDKIGFPDPLNWIIKGIVGIVILVLLMQQLGVSIPL